MIFIKMIFILTEQIMNGTVTMGIFTSGIEADSFEEAKDILKHLPKMKTACITQDDFQNFNFHLQDIIGTMKNEPLKMNH